ncbi:MAG: hypothetical protein ABI856_16550 [Nitrospira sp.]
MHRRIQVQAGIGAWRADPLIGLFMNQAVHPDDMAPLERLLAVVIMIPEICSRMDNALRQSRRRPIVWSTHKRIEITLNVYAHTLSSMQQAAAAKLERWLHG